MFAVLFILLMLFCLFGHEVSAHEDMADVFPPSFLL